MLYTTVDLFPSPHIAVFKVFKNIDLLGSCRSISFPAAPVPVIVEIVLSGAGLKNFIPGYGPGKFVFEGAHFWVFLRLY